jgi:hypothetical protein
MWLTHTEPHHWFYFAVIASAWFVRRGREWDVQKRLLTGTFLIYVFYLLSFSVYHVLSGIRRYWIGFDIALFVCFATALSDLMGKKQGPRERRWIGKLAAVLLFALTVYGGLFGKAVLKNREDLAWAGQMSEQIIPPEMTVSTSEMNTFGLMMKDREVIDLWGYTAPEIAKSGFCNELGFRNNPEYFMSVRPDVFWAWSWAREGGNAESYLANFWHTSRRGNLLGDMTRVLAEYDVFILEFTDRALFFLVKKASAERFANALASHRFRIDTERPFNDEKFKAAYEKDPLRLLPC